MKHEHDHVHCRRRQGCDIYEATPSGCEVLVFGHNADLYSLAWHPAKPDVFATACESSRVSIWDAGSRDMSRSCSVGFKARACAFSVKPLSGEAHHLAVGGDKGDLIVVNEANMQPLFNAKDFSQVLLGRSSGCTYVQSPLSRAVGLGRQWNPKWLALRRCPR